MKRTVIVDRYKSDEESTLSYVRVLDQNNNVIFKCFGLEDEYREEKVKHETRIPAGTYKLKPRSEGGFYNRYTTQKRFKHFHEEMIEIADVPDFTFVLIHCGNDESDTSGCLLLGADRDEGRMYLLNSTLAYTEFYKHVIEAVQKGHATIQFIDNDR